MSTIKLASRHDEDDHGTAAILATATATLANIDSDSNLYDPSVAWLRLLQTTTSTNKILFVDTHTHAHLERHEEEVAENSGGSHIYRQSAIPRTTNELQEHIDDGIDHRIVVMSCAVDIDDWEKCLEYASKSQYRIPAIGVHPWYVESVLLSSTAGTAGSSTDNDTDGHDLTPISTTTTTTTIKKTSSWWLDQMEALLQLHPGCMVGEIGLCKVAKFIRTYHGGKQAALQMQRQIFHQQLLLAAKYRRPVSIHCVNQHGVLLDILNSLLQPSDSDNGEYHPIPPVMALHSYTGTAHHVQAMLQWEKQVRVYQNKSTSSTTDPLIYFGFSHCVNYMMCTSTKSKRQGIETLRSIPRNRLLVESDVHCSDFVPLGAAGTIAYMAHVLHDSLENIATLTTQNGLRFLATIQNVSRQRGDS
jgi:TatD DNase family protein